MLCLCLWGVLGCFCFAGWFVIGFCVICVVCFGVGWFGCWCLRVVLMLLVGSFTVIDCGLLVELGMLVCTFLIRDSGSLFTSLKLLDLC